MIQFTDEQKQRLLQWAVWLEKTDKQQAQGALYNGEGYCCLGLWLDYYYTPQWKKDNSIMENRNYYVPICSNTEYYIHSEVCNLINHDCMLLGIDQDAFQTLNDTLDYSFTQIAREIRSLINTGMFTTDTQELLYNK